MIKKVLFTATIDGHIKAFHIPYLKWFKDEGWETYVAANSLDDNPAEGEDLGCEIIPYCDHKYNIDIQRSPFDRRNLKAYKQLKSILKSNKFDLIHCHTPMGGVITRMAANKYRKNGTMVFYTAHGFHFYKGGPKSARLMYYPMEKFLAKKTDVLITLNHEDYDIAGCKFRPGCVEYVPGVGIDTKEFIKDQGSRDRIRNEFFVAEDKILLLSVGELNENKNHEVIIRALGKLQNENIIYIVCGDGILREHLSALARSEGATDRFILAGYREDIIAFYSAADIFCHSSFREGLPVSLMQAMATGLPVICSKIRGNVDLVSDGTEGFLVSGNDINTYKEKIDLLRADPEKRYAMGKAAGEKAALFDLEIVMEDMIRIYKNKIQTKGKL